MACTKLQCTKCGSKDISTTYHRNRNGCSFTQHNQDTNEHLHRTCRNCSYDWCDPTKDQQDS